MSLALYRKYRSRTLSEVVGQDHVTELLASAIKQGKVAHAYLFTGPRGVGKTSIARILAHEINGLPYDDEATHLDIIEIDAASNNGVEDIRDLRERVQIAPVNAKKKVYIIDEVHMLSKQAFNALLKTLEEPPEHVVFILATTDIDKVPETIISRTQRHAFRRASEQDIIKNLSMIAKKEHAEADEQALSLIARHADGSFRDSVSLFDQLLAGRPDGKKITVEQAQRSLGLVADDSIKRLLTATAAGDIAAIDGHLKSLEADGIAPRTIASQLTHTLRSRLASQPELIRLLDGLLDVSRSGHPDLKLLTVLSLFNPSVQAAVPLPVPKQAAPNTTVSATKPSAKTATMPATPTPKKEDPAAIESAPKPAKKKKPAAASSPFNWAQFVEHVRLHHVALYSVLSKCDPVVEGDKLTLYAKSAFYKKKLDDVKYRVLVNDSLKELGYSYEVEVQAGAMPPKDEHAARITAMMGGGEEVSVDET